MLSRDEKQVVPENWVESLGLRIIAWDRANFSKNEFLFSIRNGGGVNIGMARSGIKVNQGLIGGVFAEADFLLISFFIRLSGL